MKKLIIMRGCPGSGKSTKANELAKQYKDEGLVVVICSADSFFINNGNYTFDAKLLPKVHSLCQGKVCGAMEAEANIVIVDNTNVRRADYEHYINLAKLYGYNIEEIVVGLFDEVSVQLYASRNIHGVPIESIRKMAARFEK